MAASAKPYLQPEILARIGDLELRARSVIEGFVSGMHRSPYQGHSVEFAQHREYTPGDDIRHLDWRVYGKSDRFYIKQYEAETNLRSHILVDCSASMRYPEQDLAQGRMTKFEYAATLAASIAYLLVNQQDAVGLMLFDEAIRASLPPLSHQPHLKSILHQLELARPNRTTSARAVFTEIATQLRRRSLVVLISDLLADVDQITEALGRLRHAGHEVIVFHLLDHDERQFPFQDYTMFDGLEAVDQQLFTDPQSLRNGYLKVLAGFIERLKSACTNRRIDFVELSTADRLDVALRAYLAAREHLIKAIA
jgi:uncharacterized protein (DUF58 family)